ncbi:MAG: cobalamin-binding protein [Pyrinomonadaceae bacterium]|nr:cobalamin-binding protein [Pyrinomonadaceae bacterium]
MRFGLYILLAAMLLGACGGNSSPAKQHARTVTDGIGREVGLPERVDRAVSLAPSITEMIFAAGAGDRLVGVTTFCDFPAKAKKIEKVGDTQTPNVERIVGLRPQVVFVSTASQLEAFTDVLGRQGISVYVLDIKGIGDVAGGLRTLGEIFGTADASVRAAEELERRAAAVEQRAASMPKVPVFVQISREPLFTIGRESFVTEIVARAGGDVMTKDIATAYPTLSKETALAMNPPVILLSDSEDNREPNEAFAASDAVKNGRVYRINPDIISRPGPRLVDAMEEIARVLSEK